MINEVSKKSWIRIRILINTQIESTLATRIIYLPQKVESDNTQIVTCRERTYKQTDKRTNKRSDQQTCKNDSFRK